MKEVGVQADKESIDNMIKSINGRKLHDLVSEGQSKLASISAPAAAGIFKLIYPFRRRFCRCCSKRRSKEGRAKEGGKERRRG